MIRVVAMLRLARPLILPGGILAYALGAAMAYGQHGTFDWGLALAGLLVTEVANVAAHFADEYADLDTDVLTRRTWFSGGSGVLPAGLVPPAWALAAALGCALLAVALAVGLIAAGVLPVAGGWILALGLVGGWFYSMPPLRLERRGLGEPANALIGGLLMPLMGYAVQTGDIAPAAVAALLPMVAIVLANLLAVHWADREADAAVGKQSLVVVAGGRARWLHHGLLAGAYLLVLALTGWLLPLAVTAAMALSLPLTLWAVASFGRQRSPVPGALAMGGALLAAAVGWVIHGARIGM